MKKKHLKAKMGNLSKAAYCVEKSLVKYLVNPTKSNGADLIAEIGALSTIRQLSAKFQYKAL